MEGVICIANDVLLYGKTPEEHDKHLEDFLEHCLRTEKFGYRFTTVAFHGHILTDNGLIANPEKVKAIVNTPSENLKSVWRLNGMVNYFSRFLAQMADLIRPIRQLTYKGTQWQSGADQQNAFERIKNVVSTPPILSH